jgi:hypothetical protein
VVVTSGACARGTLFGFFFRESTIAVEEAQGLVFSSRVVVVW